MLEKNDESGKEQREALKNIDERRRPTSGLCKANEKRDEEARDARGETRSWSEQEDGTLYSDERDLRVDYEERTAPGDARWVLFKIHPSRPSLYTFSNGFISRNIHGTLSDIRHQRGPSSRRRHPIPSGFASQVQTEDDPIFFATTAAQAGPGKGQVIL